MAKKLYVGNLPFSSTEDSVREHFAQHGEVLSVKLISDPQTGRPRGFGFIEMENADAAIAELNDKEFEGRPLKVNEARPRENNRGGGGRFGGGGGRRRF
ncbi:MAG: RNA-binding protein [Chitinivibrionales bacterium]|nr:RNA-binding protein [Chitinivibrionales bacterium]